MWSVLRSRQFFAVGTLLCLCGQEKWKSHIEQRGGEAEEELGTH